MCCDAALANDGGPLFDAGDDGPVALPPKFGAVAEGVMRAREICRRYDYEADKRVKEEGWPPPKESGRCRVARVHLDGTASCWRCSWCCGCCCVPEVSGVKCVYCALSLPLLLAAR